MLAHKLKGICVKFLSSSSSFFFFFLLQPCLQEEKTQPKRSPD